MAIGSVSNTLSTSMGLAAQSGSAVQRVLKAQEDSKPPASEEPFTEQEWYLRAKVAQLQGQIDFYSNVPSGVSDSAMSSIQAEINGILTQLQEKADAKSAEAAAKQKEVLDAQAAAKLAAEVKSPEVLLARAKTLATGGSVGDPPDAIDDIEAASDVLSVEQLLKRSKDALAQKRGGTVDTTA